MLQNLHVKNLALIDEADVEFSEGLNILSGETGAGKSIIIGSINLALGEKVQKEMLRENGENALVELVFFVEDEKTIQALRKLEVEPEENTVILSRKISGGRAIARINGEAVSVSRMKEAASLLIDIHGQHEHQSLLSKRKHLEILDEYAKNQIGSLKDELAECYHAYRKLASEYENSNLDKETRSRELSLLEYEVKEIEDAALTVGEDELLEQEFRRYSNARRIMEGVHQAYAATGSGEESATELVGRALRELGFVSEFDPAIAEMEKELSEIDSLLNDFNHELASYMDNAEFDEETFFETQKRLDLVNHLKSKYGASIEEILKNCEEKNERIQVLNDYDSYLRNLDKSVKQKEQELRAASEKLSGIRKKAAKPLTAAIKEALTDLNFLDVVFDMKFETLADYTANGMDDAEFLISTNPGEPVKQLGKVASGGELSRIMLAVKTVLADADAVESLIFDEIDSGISGRTAQMVSEKMNTLARRRQIICITHLPQIAAMADTHFLIEKQTERQSTHTRIRRLEQEESVQELARMLGGVEITEAVIENAREMREMAYMKK